MKHLLIFLFSLICIVGNSETATHFDIQIGGGVINYAPCPCVDGDFCVDLPIGVNDVIITPMFNEDEGVSVPFQIRKFVRENKKFMFIEHEIINYEPYYFNPDLLYLKEKVEK